MTRMTCIALALALFAAGDAWAKAEGVDSRAYFPPLGCGGAASVRSRTNTATSELSPIWRSSTAWVSCPPATSPKRRSRMLTR